MGIYVTCHLFLWEYHTPSHHVRSCFWDGFSAPRKSTERSKASVNEFLSVAHNWKEWKPLIQQTAADSWILLPSNQLKSSSLQSLGTLRPWMKDKATRNLPWDQSEQKVVMIAIMMMIEMMIQSAPRAQGTASSLAHLLIPAIRTPAHLFPAPSDIMGSFYPLCVSSPVPLFVIYTARSLPDSFPYKTQDDI